MPHQIKYSTVRKVLILGVDGNETLRTISIINVLPTAVFQKFKPTFNRLADLNAVAKGSLRRQTNPYQKFVGADILK